MDMLEADGIVVRPTDPSRGKSSLKKPTSKRWIVSFARRAGLLVALAIGVPGSLASAPPSARALFDKARIEEAKLESSRKLRVNPRAWWDVARRYRSVVIADPKSGYCDDALFREAEVYREIDRRFMDRKAVQRSLATHQLLIQGYPGSKWVAASRYARSDLLLNRLSDGDAGKRELKLLVDAKPRSDEAKKARKILSDWESPKEATSLVPVRNIRHWVGRGLHAPGHRHGPEGPLHPG